MTDGVCVKTTHCYKPEDYGGAIDMRYVMKMFRCGFKTLGGMAVEDVQDHSTGTGADEVEYRLEGGSSVLLKTSADGTELTVCISIEGDRRENAEGPEKRVREDIESIVYMDLRAGYCCE